LNEAELVAANTLLARVRADLDGIAGGDADLLFALRRKVAKELVHDERSKPMARRALKKRMRGIQNGLCPLCTGPLPERYCVLDRFNAADGYFEGNVRLLCEPCDRQAQADRGYR
jgi:hypothetical protein